jgi:hypothetical protein
MKVPELTPRQKFASYALMLIVIPGPGWVLVTLYLALRGCA